MCGVPELHHQQHTNRDFCCFQLREINTLFILLKSVVATSSTFRLEANVVDSSFVLSPFHSSPDVNKVHIKLFTEV